MAERRFEILKRTREAVQEPLYELALSETRLILEVSEWINKSSGRGELRVLIQEPDGDEREVQDWGTVYLGTEPYEKVLPNLFPWAELRIDENFYADNEEEEYGWRPESAPDELRPYQEDGEIASWRLELRPSVIYQANQIVDTLPDDHPDRAIWRQLLEQAELSHQADGWLRAEAERIIATHGK